MRSDNLNHPSKKAMVSKPTIRAKSTRFTWSGQSSALHLWQCLYSFEVWKVGPLCRLNLHFLWDTLS